MVGHSSTFYNVGRCRSCRPWHRPASAVSAAVDLQNNDSVAFVVSVGAAGDTCSGANRVEAALQESSDNVTFTPVADSDMQRVVSGGQATGTFLILNANAQASQVYAPAYTRQQALRPRGADQLRHHDQRHDRWTCWPCSAAHASRRSSAKSIGAAPVALTLLETESWLPTR